MADFFGTPGDDVLPGPEEDNSGDDQFFAGEGNDTVDGGAGADQMDLAGGNDTAFGGAGADNISGGADDDVLDGGAGVDFIDGGGGNDTLDGGSGADYLIGNFGDDTYHVDNAGDTLTEYSLGDGTDTVISQVSFTLGQFLENLTLTGSAALSGAGNGLANTITGNAGGNALSGGGDSDTLIGLGGNDILDGGASADTMEGGAGNDIYNVDDGGDVVVEAAGQGTADEVISSIDFDLAGTGVENLTLIGSAVNGVGNELANTITANEEDNSLSGLEGSDTILGEGGEDSISGGDGNDESAGRHDDDTLDGGEGNDDLQGGDDFDTLVGGLGNDTLDGGANSSVQGDFLLGGDGDDTYLVDSALDFVDEGNFPEFAVFGFGGTDTIVSTADFFWDLYSIGETLRISEDAVDPGADGTTAVGSVFDNEMVGNSETNVLFGRGGSDTYRAGDGIDFMSLSTLGLTDENAYDGVDGVNTVIVEQRTSGANSYDIVFEFESGKDKVDVSDYGFGSAAAAFATGVDDGAGNCYFVLGDGLDYLYMVGVELSGMAAGDFIV